MSNKPKIINVRSNPMEEMAGKGYLTVRVKKSGAGEWLEALMGSTDSSEVEEGVESERDDVLFCSLRTAHSAPCLGEYCGYEFLYVDQSGVTIKDLGVLFDVIRREIDEEKEDYEGVEIEKALEKLNFQMTGVAKVVANTDTPRNVASSLRSTGRRSFNLVKRNSKKKTVLGTSLKKDKSKSKKGRIFKFQELRANSVKVSKRKKRKSKEPRNEFNRESFVPGALDMLDSEAKREQKNLKTWSKRAMKQLSNDLQGSVVHETLSLQSYNLIFEEENLIGGDLKGIVFCLIKFLHEKDVFYTKNIIFTHKLYARSQYFFECFSQIYEESKDDFFNGPLLRESIVDILKLWFSIYVYDFKDMGLVADMNNFIRRLKSGDEIDQEYSTELMKSWSTAMKTVTEIQNIVSNHPMAPKIYLSKKYTNLTLESINYKEFSVLDFHPVEIARQITIIDHSYFMKIPLTELMNKNFEKEDQSPFVKKVYKWFNHLSQWAATEIVTEPTMKKRAKILGHFILIAEKLNDIQNMNAVIAIGSSLSSYPIFRLKKTWSKLPSSLMTKWKLIEKLINPTGNFKMIRQKQLSAVPPIIPAITLIFHEIILIEDGNTQYLNENGSINLEKSFLMGKLFTQFVKFQQVHYVLKTVELLVKYIKEKATLPPSDIDEFSYSLEKNKL